MRLPTLHQLELFVAVARCGSFARAADHLLLSPASVTMQIQHLEQHYGTRLFNRTSRGAILTEAGTELFATADSLFAGLLNAATTIERIKQSAHGQLNIGGTELVGIYQLPLAVAMFRRRCPRVEVNLLAAHTARIEQALLSGAIEVAIVAGDITSKGLVVEPCGSQPVELLVHPGNPLAAMSRVPQDALAHQVLLLREPGSTTRAVVQEAITKYGLVFHDIVQIEGAEAVTQAVVQNRGVGFGLAANNQVELRLGQIVAVPIEGVSIDIPFFVVRRANRVLSGLAQEFVQRCRELLLKRPVPTSDLLAASVEPNESARASRDQRGGRALRTARRDRRP